MELSKENVDYLLSIKYDDITTLKIKELFAASVDRDAKYNTNDTFILPKDTVFNKKEIRTTVGRYIFNLLILSPTLGKNIEYINTPMTKGAVGDLDDEVAALFIEDYISSQDIIDYIDKMGWLGYGLNKFLVESITGDLFDPIKEVMQRRDELFELHKDELEKGNIIIAANIEKELVALAERLGSNIPGMEIYQSGAAKKFGNNYKNSSIMRGPVLDNATNKYNISKSNLVEGIKKEEFYIYADLPVLGSYSRGVSTQEGGYQKKILEAALQLERIGPKDSDCGSKGYITVTLTKKNINNYKLRYAVTTKGTLLITSENADQLIGKTVKLRTPIGCLNQEICNKCMGEKFYKLDINEVGLMGARVGTRLLNASMKAFHDVSIKITDLNIDDHIQEYK